MVWLPSAAFSAATRTLQNCGRCAKSSCSAVASVLGVQVSLALSSVSSPMAVSLVGNSGNFTPCTRSSSSTVPNQRSKSSLRVVVPSVQLARHHCTNRPFTSATVLALFTSALYIWSMAAVLPLASTLALWTATSSACIFCIVLSRTKSTTCVDMVLPSLVCVCCIDHG